MKLREKGIKIDEKIEQFTVGNDREIDMHIAKYDVNASIAHAKMLFSIGIITATEFQQLEKGLSILEKQIHEAPEYYLWTHNRWKHNDKVPVEFQ